MQVRANLFHIVVCELINIFGVVALYHHANEGIDPDVLAFFRKSGKGYQTTINAVLRKYVESRKSRTG